MISFAEFMYRSGIRAIFREVRDWLKAIWISDRRYVIKKHELLMGRTPDVDNPKTLNEKILWLKLNDRTALHTQCADKYAVRKFVKERIGEKYLVPLVLNTKNVKDIHSDTLPDYPVIVKPNHDSGGGVIVRNKSDMNWEKIQLFLKRRLQRNYYYHGREWQYRNIKPLIIVERLLTNDEGEIPFDYKLHVINGKVNMIQVDMGRGTDSHYRNWYSRVWNREPYKWSSPKGPEKFTDPSLEDIPKPESLDTMIELSEVLAEPFDYARVDWYDLDGTLYFGEITFHHDGGNQPILPEKYDRILGDKLILSSKN